eukprot:UN11064
MSMSSRTLSNDSNDAVANTDSADTTSYSYSTSLTSTGITVDTGCERSKCCRCLEIRAGIFMLGLWSILITIGYYIGFLLLWGSSSHSHRHILVHYPLFILYGLSALGFIGGSFGILAAIFQSVALSKVFFLWAVIRFFCQFIEGILYAAAGYSLYILFFIDFVPW